MRTKGLLNCRIVYKHVQHKPYMYCVRSVSQCLLGLINGNTCLDCFSYANSIQRVIAELPKNLFTHSFNVHMESIATNTELYGSALCICKYWWYSRNKLKQYLHNIAIEHYPYCLVLVGSRNRFEPDITIKLK